MAEAPGYASKTVTVHPTTSETLNIVLEAVREIDSRR